jgi:hypothetical protein
MSADVKGVAFVPLGASESADRVGLVKNDRLNAAVDQLMGSAETGAAGSNYNDGFIAHRIGLFHSDDFPGIQLKTTFPLETQNYLSPEYCTKIQVFVNIQI